MGEIHVWELCMEEGADNLGGERCSLLFWLVVLSVVVLDVVMVLLVSADILFSFVLVKASNSIIATDTCLLTCLVLPLCGRPFRIDLHRVAGP